MDYYHRECNTLQGERKKKKNAENMTEEEKVVQPKTCFELAAAGRKMPGLLLGGKCQVIPKTDAFKEDGPPCAAARSDS